MRLCLSRVDTLYLLSTCTPVPTLALYPTVPVGKRVLYMYIQDPSSCSNDHDCSLCTLQAMGWSEGQGLGRANQGIVEPIKVSTCVAIS